MSIHTILSQEIEKFDKKFVWHPSGGGEYWYHTGNPTEAKQWIKSFATRIVEKVGRELIGEDSKPVPYCGRAQIGCDFSAVGGMKIKAGDTVEFPGSLSEEEIIINKFRASQRTKLQKMKEI